MTNVHLVGIGGMHMSAIAQILLADGVSVSGSDLTLSPLTDRLMARGARIHAGHSAANLGDATLVVTTAAAKNDNVELMEARRRAIPIISRHAMVARLMEGRLAVAVAGTHGKTTTSSMVAVILQRAGLEPGYLLGGESVDLGGNAAGGAGRYVVVEADEYAGAFLAYHPQIAVVTNVEADHLDYFGSEAGVLDAFSHFIRNIPGDGIIIACADSPRLREIIPSARTESGAAVIWYGLDHAANWQAREIALSAGGGSEFSVVSPGGDLGRFTMLLPGRHNVTNALAACIAAHRLGVDWATIRGALAAFHGAHRRFELVGEAAGVTIVDDYAHHPTEIRATLAAARSRFPGRRIVILFQPHTYSRTQYLLEAFRSCFADADSLYLLQTFAARETAEAGLDAHSLAHHLDRPLTGFAEDLSEAIDLLTDALAPGDVFFSMGAGDVTRIGPGLLEALRRR